MMKFEGILGNMCGDFSVYTGTDKKLQARGFEVSGGIPVLRGFASTSVLAAYSIKDNNYQRKDDGEDSIKHIESIKEFLINGKQVGKFLPEVVLVARGEYELQPITGLIEGKNATANGQIENLNFYNLYVKENSLYRIDGNHRLEAGKELEKYISFAIILWDNSTTAQDDEAFLFHFLNGKAKKLTSEENFKGLVKSTSWTDDELRNVNPVLPYLRIFDKDFLSGKVLKKTYFEKPLSQIEEILEKIYKEQGVIPFNEEKFAEMITHLDELLPQYKNEYIFKNFKSLLAQLIFYCLFKRPDENESKIFIDKINIWLKKYKHQAGSFECPIKLYNIAVQHLEQKVFKIFVAMPYWEAKVVPYNTMFKEILSDIENTGNSSFKLELFPIMRHKGKSERIDRRLLNQIDESDIFIADLTTSNINVIFEIAYAEGKGKPIILIRDKKDKTLVPFDMDKLQYVPYNMEIWRDNIPLIIKNNMKEILEKDYYQTF